MIDWAYVAVHSLWILGLSIVLAAFSYHDWLRQERGIPLRKQLREPGWRLPFYGGLLLVAAAFVIMRSSAWWERLLWLLLGVSFGRDAYAAWRELRAGTNCEHGNKDVAVQAGDARKQREVAFQKARFAEDADARRVTEKYYRVAQSAVDYYRERVLACCRGKRLLEYGCSNGGSARLWDRAGAAVTGIDISPEGIENARRAALECGRSLRFEVMDAEALRFPDSSFDVVVGSGILHHLNLDRAYAELCRVCAPDGRAIFFEPMGHNPIINLYRRLTPSLRTPDEHPLRLSDLARAREYFSDVRTSHFMMLALLATPLHRWPKLLRAALSLLTSVDHAVLALPFLRRYSWIVVLELSRPRKAGASERAAAADQSV